MANFRVVISDPKSRRAFQKEVDQTASGFLGKKIGEKVPGTPLGLDGYHLEVTGGSDKEGFPMRRDVDGSGRKRIVLTQPPGFRPERKGQRKRKSVRGNLVSADITQINVKVAEYGKKSIEELFGVKKEEKKAEPKAEAPKEQEKKEEHKAEHKPAEKPTQKTEEKPKEEPKEHVQEKAEAKMGVKKVE